MGGGCGAFPFFVPVPLTAGSPVRAPSQIEKTSKQIS